MNGLWLALSFLTTLPLLPAGYRYEARHWRGAVLWFPVAGLLVGAAMWLVGLAAGLLFAGWLPAVLAVAAWAAVTGGLHLDGLADCCDGLLAAVEPQRRLEIMRDPRVGTFGAVGLMLTLALKVSAVQEVLSAGRGVAILAAALLARTSILWLARQPSARADGMGAHFAQQIELRALLLATLPVAAGAMLLGWRGVAALVAAALATAGVVRLAKQRIGGVTGDVYGLGVELVELAVLLVFAVQWQG